MVPATLGARGGKLVQKVSALLHGLRLETHDVDHLQDVLCRVVSVTTDFGAEVGIADALKGVDLLSWLDPELQQVQPAEADDGAGTGDGAAGSGSPAVARSGREHVFPRAIPIAGLCHIFDNLTHQSHEEAMCHWGKYVEDLRTLLGLLTQKAERECLRDCMRRNGANNAEMRLLESDVPNILHWRWGSLYRTLQHLLPMRPVLQRFRTSFLVVGPNM